MLRLPLHLLLSFAAVHVMAFYVMVCALGGDGHVGRFVTAAAGAVLAFGATVAFFERTWGVGVMLMGATAFFVAGALGMGPPFFYLVAGVGALPFVFSAKHMARFHLGATVLFAAIAGVLGTAASLAWDVAAPTVIEMFAR